MCTPPPPNSCEHTHAHTNIAFFFVLQKNQHHLLTSCLHIPNSQQMWRHAQVGHPFGDQKLLSFAVSYVLAHWIMWRVCSSTDSCVCKHVAAAVAILPRLCGSTLSWFSLLLSVPSLAQDSPLLLVKLVCAAYKCIPPMSVSVTTYLEILCHPWGLSLPRHLCLLCHYVALEVQCHQLVLASTNNMKPSCHQLILASTSNMKPPLASIFLATWHNWSDCRSPRLTELQLDHVASSCMSYMHMYLATRAVWEWDWWPAEKWSSQGRTSRTGDTTSALKCQLCELTFMN